MDIGKINEPIDLAPGEWIDEIPALPGARDDSSVLAPAEVEIG